MEIRLQEITKAFGEKRVIAPTTFTIPSGKFTTLLGPSGCGKTTLAADDRRAGDPGHRGNLV